MIIDLLREIWIQCQRWGPANSCESCSVPMKSKNKLVFEKVSALSVSVLYELLYKSPKRRKLNMT